MSEAFDKHALKRAAEHAQRLDALLVAGEREAAQVRRRHETLSGALAGAEAELERQGRLALHVLGRIKLRHLCSDAG